LAQVAFDQPSPLSGVLRMAGYRTAKPQFVCQFLPSAQPNAALQPEACLDWKSGQLLIDPRDEDRKGGEAGP
jgi:hypothetical protein